jgi:hypothetical protein
MMTLRERVNSDGGGFVKEIDISTLNGILSRAINSYPVLLRKRFDEFSTPLFTRVENFNYYLNDVLSATDRSRCLTLFYFELRCEFMILSYKLRKLAVRSGNVAKLSEDALSCTFLEATAKFLQSTFHAKQITNNLQYLINSFDSVKKNSLSAQNLDTVVETTSKHTIKIILNNLGDSIAGLSNDYIEAYANSQKSEVVAIENTFKTLTDPNERMAFLATLFCQLRTSQELAELVLKVIMDTSGSFEEKLLLRAEERKHLSAIISKFVDFEHLKITIDVLSQPLE